MDFSNIPQADDATSVTGGMFETAAGSAYDGNSGRVPVGGSAAGPASSGSTARGVGAGGVTRSEARTSRGYGRGPAPTDPRKYRYDLVRGKVMPSIPFGATKADRLDAVEAGDLLDKIHKVVGIDTEQENVLVAFDRALFFEHTINGASILQPGRGVLSVGESEFELRGVKEVLGVDVRRFFRAFADDIAEVNRDVVKNHDPHDPVSCEKFGQLMQVAIERGLQKYPHLAHDSSDAGVRLSAEERIALMNSKRVVLESTVNNVDKITPRAGSSSNA